MAEEEVQAFAVEDDSGSRAFSAIFGSTVGTRRCLRKLVKELHTLFVKVHPDLEVDSRVVLQCRVSAALAWCFQSTQTNSEFPIGARA